MEIAVDIDEVKLNFIESFLNLYNRLYLSSYTREDVFDYDVSSLLGLSREKIFEELDYFYKTPDFLNITPVDGAYQALKSLRAKRINPVSITSRPEKLEEITKYQLEKNFPDILPNKGIFFSSELFQTSSGMSKGDICLKKGIELLIDDSWNIACDASQKGVHVLLMDSPWNRSKDESEYTNITRVFSWQDILSQLDSN